jgi:20S proteasome alpha/beta subunit
MAGDRRVTADGVVLPERPRKVFRFKDGRLFGCAGGLTQALELRDAARDNATPPKLAAIEAIMVHPDGVMWAYDDKRWMRVKGPYVALGSGALGALCVMAMGHGAVEAVRAACKHDTNSGGGVAVVKLKIVDPTWRQ